MRDLTPHELDQLTTLSNRMMAEYSVAVAALVTVVPLPEGFETAGELIDCAMEDPAGGEPFLRDLRSQYPAAKDPLDRLIITIGHFRRLHTSLENR